MSVEAKKKELKKKDPIDSELFVIIFLMLIIIVVPLAISIWDIGTPIPGFAPFNQSI
jgi:hypothetical protein